MAQALTRSYLLQLVASCFVSTAGIGTGSLDQHAQRIAADFRLNSDQVSVLQHCSMWAASSKVSITTAYELKRYFPLYAKLVS